MTSPLAISYHWGQQSRGIGQCFKPLGRQLWRSTKKVAEGRKASCTNMAKSSELIRVLWFAKLCSFVALFSQLESLKQEYNLSKGQSPVPTQNSNDSSTGSPVVWKAQKVACWSSCPDHCTVLFSDNMVYFISAFPAKEVLNWFLY